MTHDGLHDGFLDVSRETMRKLEHFVSLLIKWNSSINLIGKSTESDIWNRHIRDSLQVTDHIPAGVDKIADIGSGGGFPGIVTCITRPNVRSTLVESDKRKAAFLRTCIREMNLNADVMSERVETVAHLGITCLTARALAPLEELLGFATRHVMPDGVCVFPKGRSAPAEIEAALTNWDFHCQSFSSITDPEAAVLVITRISRK